MLPLRRSDLPLVGLRETRSRESGRTGRLPTPRAGLSASTGRIRKKALQSGSAVALI
jgi:hypothetical protein